MKIRFLKHLFCTLFIVASAGWAQANLIEMQVNQSIPDGDLSGLASTINLSGLSTPVGNLEVELNISGTYNGDLYAYLTHEGGFTVLLNRVGTTSGNSLGYGDHGFNVTFGNSAPDIHNYQGVLAGSGSLPLVGPLTGTWGPDGRAVSPLTVTDADSRSAFLSSFQGLDANGQWTLFVADVNGGDLHQLASWGLEWDALVTQVPDSGNTTMLLLIGILSVSLAGWCYRSSANFRNNSNRMRRASLLQSYSARAVWLGLLMASLCPGWAQQGGSVTGWGRYNVYPPNGYGARFTKIIARPLSDPNRAIKTDGTVVTWGRGDLVLPDGWDQTLDFRISRLSGLALRPDGTVVTWGLFNDFVDGPGIPTTPPSGLSDVIAIDAAPSFDLALTADGTVTAWGVFSLEHHGLGGFPYASPATAPSGLNGVVAISAGYAHALALLADGTVTAWGNDSSGQCDVPSNLSGVVAVAAGNFHSLALKSDGTGAIWGEMVLDDSFGFVPATPPPTDLTGVIAIAAGGNHCVALKHDGTVVAWGRSKEGQCNAPSGLTGVVAVAAGSDYSFALKSDGSVTAWGSASALGTSPNGLSGIVAIGQGEYHSLVVQADGKVLAFGDNIAGAINVPANLSDVVAVAGGWAHSLALRKDGSVVGWGEPGFYDANVPSGLNGVIAISASEEHSLALKSNGTVVEWGGSGVSEVPGGLSEVAAIAAGGSHSLALKVDGSVVAWGKNNFGQCNVPFGLRQVVAIAAGDDHSLALKADGSVVAWGASEQGECDVPEGLHDVKAVAAGYASSLALKTDGTVVAWGRWDSPVPSGLNGAVAIAAGGEEGLALFDTVNRPPLTAAVELVTSRNRPNTTRLFNIQRACSDPDWDSFIITGVSEISARGGHVAIDGSSILYKPPLDYVGSDSFSYTLRDSRGGESQGTVQVTIKDAVLSGEPMAGLFNTGVDRIGGVLTDGTIGDPHYTLLSVPSDTTVIRVRTAVGGGVFSSGNYLEDDFLSAWIGPNNSDSVEGPAGRYDYQTTFDLCGFDPSTARIIGQWAKDDFAVDILLNGVSIGNGRSPDPSFSAWAPFTIDSGFVAGLNTVDFIVDNQGGSTGVRVEMSGTANPLLVADTYELRTSRDVAGLLPLAKLHPACDDSNEASLTIAKVSASSAANGTVQLNGSLIVYTPPLDFVGVDSFTYTLRDSRGSTAEGTVLVTVNAPVGAQGRGITGWGRMVVYPPGGYGAQFTKIAAGNSHSIALKADGTVVAWGNNDFGQCNLPDRLSGVVAISAGGDHNLALKGDGTVAAWGSNGSGQGNVPAGLSGVVAIAAGLNHSLAAKADGTIVAWGSNSDGQCDVPVGLGGVMAVAAGGWHSLALKSDGTVVAWGKNDYGQSDSVNYVFWSPVVSITAGLYHSQALCADGMAVVWGNSDIFFNGGAVIYHGMRAIASGWVYGLMVDNEGIVHSWGSDDHGQRDFPAGLTGVVAVAAGSGHSLALKADGTVIAWGDNTFGQSTDPRGLSGAVAGAAGNLHILALKEDGTVVAWGDNSEAQCDVPDRLSGVVAVAAGQSHSLALRSDGSVVAWGRDAEAQCDMPTGLNQVVAIAARGNYSLALQVGGTVVKWGSGSDDSLRLPVGLRRVTSVAAGDTHILALQEDGTVAASINWDVPNALAGVVAIAAGYAHDLALRADGTLVAWGANSAGQCDVPAGLGNVVAIAAGTEHSLAVKADGTVVAWGDNSNGQCYAPAGLNGVTAVVAGGYFSLALFGGMNKPPVAGTYAMAASRNMATALSLFKLHQASSDPDWDTFIITEVSLSSTAGGAARIVSSSVVYTPPTDFVGADSFTYTVRDSRGASSQGTVNVTVNPTAIGDLNNDGCVDRGDLAILMTRIQARSTDLTYDLNHDGKVDVADARFLALHFTNRDGSSCAP